MENESLNEIVGSQESSQLVGQEVPQAPEKMISESKVQEIVRHSNARVAEKVRREEAERYKSSEKSANSSIGNMTQDDLNKLIAEHATKIREEESQRADNDARIQAGERIANEFMSKLEVGGKDYSDFDDVVGSLPFQNFPHIVGIANQYDNTAGIMYELAKNPSKLASIQLLTQTAPEMARKAIKDLADSIKLNESAKHVQRPNEPLSKLQPSSIGLDNGPLTLRDLKNQSWLRG